MVFARNLMRTVAFAADMAGFAAVNMNYWFYSIGAVTSFTGLANLACVGEMQYAFGSCTGITELDFSGFDPSHLTSLQYAFSGCSALATIYADASWALPAGVTGAQCFYGCTSLVGGAGTAFSSANVSCAYMRIDAQGAPGYLTAAAS